MTTPREALDDALFDMFKEFDANERAICADAILTALAPYLIPEGCVAVCERCGNTPGNCGFPHNIDYTGEKFATPCPLRKATP